MKVSILRGDITSLKVDAMVNAANSRLLGGGGVDGAIHRMAGQLLKEECQRIRDEIYPKGLPTGKAVITRGYNSRAKFIIHTVGPKFGIEDISLLGECYMNCLKLAEQNDCKTIAFPSISTGAYGVPIEKAIDIVKRTLDNYTSTMLQEVILVLHSELDFNKYKAHFEK